MTDERLVEAFRAGEKSALDVLLTRFKPLVKAKAKAYYAAGGDAEDLIQEGMIGLYKAVLDFDREKNDSFAAFAGMCIVRQVQTAVKAASRRKHSPLNESLSLDNTASAGERQNAASFLDYLPDSKINDPEALFLGREAVRDIDDFIRENLTELESVVLKLHLEGHSHAKIAELIGKQKKSVDNTLRRIRKKISGAIAIPKAL